LIINPTTAQQSEPDKLSAKLLQRYSQRPVIIITSLLKTACAQKLIVETVERQHGRAVACTLDVLSMESMNKIVAKTGGKGSISPVKKKLIRLLPPLPVRKSNFVVVMFGEIRMSSRFSTNNSLSSSNRWPKIM
jgi:hypothetical protein